MQPGKHFGIATRTVVGSSPTDAEIRAATGLPERLVPTPGTSSPAETAALAAALRDDPHDDRGIAPFALFTAAYPGSRWAASLHLNMGNVSYGTGYFQDALDHWKSAWELAKDARDDVSTELANRALAEYAKMNARIGRLSELDALLKQAESRTLRDDARVKITSASEGSWAMHHQPAVSFRCGPYALLSVAQEQKDKPELARKAAIFADKAQSPVTGFSIPEVHKMSADLGMKLQIAKREPGASVIVPAVAHWKVGHFGAVVREVNGSFLLKDPTFGNETWITAQAIDQEASDHDMVAVDGSVDQGARTMSSIFHRPEASVGLLQDELKLLDKQIERLAPRLSPEELSSPEVRDVRGTLLSALKAFAELAAREPVDTDTLDQLRTSLASSIARLHVRAGRSPQWEPVLRRALSRF